MGLSRCSSIHLAAVALSVAILTLSQDRALGAQDARLPATLKICATIDGSDEVRITTSSATWTHGTWQWPTNITLNGVKMDPHNVLQNRDDTQFIDPHVNIASAHVTDKKGRGLIDVSTDGDAVVVKFDDPQGGAADYEVDISFEQGDTPTAQDDDKPMTGPTTRVSSPINSIKALEVITTDSGMMLGQTSEVVLTVTRGENSKVTSARFVTPVGNQMLLARDEAMRYIHVTYPNWYVDTAELTFEDKYSGHDGGSIGTALGTLVLSSIQGFDIDSDAAITGDISANGKVRAIGGLSAKLHGATASKCKLVAIPMENVDQLVDCLVYNGPAIVTDIQVIGIGTLDDAVGVMRTDRDAKLTRAISLFADVQSAIKKSPGYLHTADAEQKLNQILTLAPHHLSAKMLLMVAQRQEPKTLSATASMYYTFVAVQAMTPILAERSQLGTTQLPSAAVKQGLADLKKLRPMADESVRPLIDAWSRFIWGWSMFQNGNSTKERFLSQAQAVDDAMASLQADHDLMQKMLKEGM